MDRRSLPGVLLLLLLAVFLGAGLLTLNNMIVYTPDSARYLAWASSLAKGDGFKDDTGPEPIRYVVHAPLYPLLLVPGEWLAANGVVAAKVTTLFVGAVVLLLMFRWVRRREGAWAGLAATTLLALNPLTFLYATQVLSDLPFGAAVILFFWYAETLTMPQAGTRTREYALVATLVAGLFLREVGVSLVLAAAAFFVWRREYRRAAFVFLVAVLFYLLWYVRNEVIIAGLENPAMRNSRVFLSHYYTPNEAGLLSELAARLTANIRVYANLLVRLMFYPDFVLRSYALISVGDPLVRMVMMILPVGQYVLAVVSIGGAALGLWLEWRRSGSIALLVCFAVLYFIPILLYPINDIRFLYPILIVMIMLWVAGAAWGIRRLRNAWTHALPRRLLAAAMLFLLLIPNLVWLRSETRNGMAYRASPVAFYERIADDPYYPESFTKPLDLAAHWIVTHSDSSAPVLTRWKETAFWLNGRKVLDADAQITPDLFDQLLRNYGVEFVVSLVSRGGLREHEVLFAQSLRFRFATAYRVANVEVVRVIPRGGPEGPGPGGRTPVTRDDSVRADFARGMALLEEEQPAKAESLFTRLSRRIGRYGALMLHIGIAKEFAGHLTAADSVFAQFRYVPQAGSYLQQAWYHQEITARLRRAEAAAVPQLRANLYHIVGVNEWEVGFRNRALQLLDESAAADSGYYPALIFKAIFDYELGRLDDARVMLERARPYAPDNILTTGLDSVLQASAQLTRAGGSPVGIPLMLRRGRLLEAMSLREEAIDDFLHVLRLDPDNREALRRVADLYFLKAIYEPAFRYYRRLAALGGADSAVSDRLRTLEQRWR